MKIDALSSGNDVPNDINIVIEIPAGSGQVKYEIDKESGALFVDRVMSTAMSYPAHYGFIPKTLSGDGDPCDVLLIANFDVYPGCVIRGRPIGVLITEDEKGQDEKILAVPHSSVHPYYDSIRNYTDIPSILIEQISHFFERYKDLEKGKWVKISGWKDSTEAGKIILNSL